ncbi:hypothetical protein B0J12DRAFT_728425 [Macrophomina phaseolina]|uniref:Uncharacterized protein n=1 Tax=Macrophomina phaseolina TaxID=35725 RepID=A0ABQ8GAQ3_9PEZI|nr:hypothetical protein B0J12DRAFT_728425 [Macrophomina phaseolina]
MSRHSRQNRQFDIHMVSVRPADPDDRPPSAIAIPGDTIVVQAEGSAADKDHENSPTLVPPWKDSEGGRAEWDPKSPKCSLNIFCRRRTRGKTVGYQITAIRSEYYGERETKRMLRNEPGLVYNDRTFFRELHNAYYYKMCSIWRRLFSLKTVRTFQLVKVSAHSTQSDRLLTAEQFTKDRTRRHTVVELDQDAFDDFLLDFYQPQMVSSNSFVHIDWIFGLKQKDHRHVLE